MRCFLSPLSPCAAPRSAAAASAAPAASSSSAVRGPTGRKRGDAAGALDAGYHRRLVKVQEVMLLYYQHLLSIIDNIEVSLQSLLFLMSCTGLALTSMIRGKLENGAVLKAICAGFQETTEPTVCLSGDVETNECLNNNGGCWQDKASNITACKDTFRGRVCECPVVQGVQFKGDGYNNCEASGLGRCRINDGGCWQHSRDGQTFSACMESGDKRCQCPPGFRGDGAKICEDINECKERRACQCSECSCKNTWGSYECRCSGDLLYIRDHDICIAKTVMESRTAWDALFVILIGLAIASAGAYIVYKYRLRSYMDSEIRAIMSQYMPLEDKGEVSNHTQEENRT